MNLVSLFWVGALSLALHKFVLPAHELLSDDDKKRKKGNGSPIVDKHKVDYFHAKINDFNEEEKKFLASLIKDDLKELFNTEHEIRKEAGYNNNKNGSQNVDKAEDESIKEEIKEAVEIRENIYDLNFQMDKQIPEKNMENESREKLFKEGNNSDEVPNEHGIHILSQNLNANPNLDPSNPTSAAATGGDDEKEQNYKLSERENTHGDGLSAEEYKSVSQVEDGNTKVGTTYAMGAIQLVNNMEGAEGEKEVKIEEKREIRERGLVDEIDMIIKRPSVDHGTKQNIDSQTLLSLQKELVKTQDEKRSLEDKCSSLLAELMKSKEKNETLEIEIDQLKKFFMIEKEKLESELVQLTEKIFEKEKLESEIGELKEQFLTENEKLEGEIQHMKFTFSAEKECLLNENKMLEAERLQLREQFSQKVNSEADFEKQKQTFVMENEKLQKDIELLKEQLSQKQSLESECNRLKEMILEREKEVEKGRIDSEEMEKEISRLRKIVSLMQKRITSMEKQMAEIVKEGEMKTKELELEFQNSMDSKSKEIEELTKTVQELHSSIEEASAREERLEKGLEEEKEGKKIIEKKIEEYEEKMKEYDDDVSLLKRTNKMLTTKIDWLVRSKKEMEEEKMELSNILEESQKDLPTTIKEASGLPEKIWDLIDQMETEFQCNDRIPEKDQIAKLKWILASVRFELYNLQTIRNLSRNSSVSSPSTNLTKQLLLNHPAFNSMSSSPPNGVRQESPFSNKPSKKPSPLHN